MQCPACGSNNPDSAQYCHECGMRLALVCAACGTQLPANAKFCFECGTRVGMANPPGGVVPSPADASSPSSASGPDRSRSPHAATQAAGIPGPAVPVSDANISIETLKRLVPKEFAERLLSTRARGSLGSERRMVTILFSDVKGSTSMAENMDPEDVMQVMNGAFEHLIAPVYRHEGTLARLMGDAILAFFGAPIAHEDDPERAIRAALEMVAGIKEYAGKLERELGISGFNIRVGINTGLVVVGEVGSDLRVEYTAIGTAINLAARMEENAPPGGILITHDTYRHIRGVFDVLPQPPLRVKGKTEPVQTYLVQAARPRAFRMPARGVEGVETRTVGRDAELLALESVYLESLAAEAPRSVTIVGEAGVGKSRLLYEFGNWIDLRPEEVYYLKGRAVPGTRHVPYALVRDMLAYRFDILDSDTPETALTKFRAGMAPALEPEEADIVGQLAGFDFRSVSPYVAALSGSESFGRLALAYLVNYIRSVISGQPVIMFLEDLHWADDSSLEVLAHLLDEIRVGPLLVVGLARLQFFERPGASGVQAGSRRVDLKPLSWAASRELVGEILKKVADLPGSLRDLVVEHAEGNPYYAEELVKMLVEDRVILAWSEGANLTDDQDETKPWRVDLTRLGQVRVPPTLAGILQARLDALPDAERAVLQRAAVVGRLFWDTLVGDISVDIASPLEFPGLLASARARELIFKSERSGFAGANEYIFKHAMLRDVVYETLLLKLRRVYHAQVAAWLETHAAGRLGEYLRVIADHYEQAGEARCAAEYLRRSGEEALKVSAFRDAQRAFERGLRLLEPAGADQSKTNLLVGLGRALLRLGDYGPAAERLAEALPLAQAAGDRQAEVATLAALGEIGQRLGHYDSSQAYLEAGLDLARRSGDTDGIVVVTRHLGRGARSRGAYAEAVRWAEESRALSAQAGNRQGAAAALTILGLVAGDIRDFEAAKRYHGESLALCKQTGDRLGAAHALNNLGVIALGGGAFAEARGYFQQAQAIVSETGDRWGSAVALLNIGETYLEEEQDEPAWNYLRQALGVSAAIQDLPSCLYVLADIARLHARAGQAARAVELLSLAISHPASDREIELIAGPALSALHASLPAEELDGALQRGRELDLEQVLQEILADGRD